MFGQIGTRSQNGVVSSATHHYVIGVIGDFLSSDPDHSHVFHWPTRLSPPYGMQLSFYCFPSKLRWNSWTEQVQSSIWRYGLHLQCAWPLMMLAAWSDSCPGSYQVTGNDYGGVSYDWQAVQKETPYCCKFSFNVRETNLLNFRVHIHQTRKYEQPI